jgi:hypothetical protein
MGFGEVNETSPFNARLLVREAPLPALINTSLQRRCFAPCSSDYVTPRQSGVLMRGRETDAKNRLKPVSIN